jgi:tRNA dimethylallyltransferase
MKNFILVVTGPTATGKSGLAEQIAQQISGEIINADIGSWYTPLTIGTAKPDLNTVRVPHHLFNILDKPEQFTVVQFRTKVLELAREIWTRGKVPVVVGGSAFYVKSLWYRTQDSGSSSHIEQDLMKSEVNTHDLWQQLSQIDADRAQKIDKNDRYRIVRALGIYKSTGKKPSTFEPIYDPVAPMYAIFCTRDRKDLYERINERTGIMLQDGWIDEVKNLMETDWEKFLIEKKIIGYDDIIRYLYFHEALQEYDTQEQYQKLISTIQQKTRNYAKRQITFLSKLEKDIQCDAHKSLKKSIAVEIDLTLCPVGLYIKGLSDQLFKTFD